VGGTDSGMERIRTSWRREGRIRRDTPHLGVDSD
jgi:hypothetical protein